MKDEDFKQIGDEFVRVLTPVYEQLDRMEQKQDTMEQKLDAHTADIMELQRKADITNDRLIRLYEANLGY